MPDTILNTTSTTSVLATNGTNHTSTIDIAADQDWWSVTLTANTTYQFRLTGNGLADPYLRLLNSTGGLITADDDAGGNRNSLITYTPSASGTFYVSAQGYANNIGDYILTATSSASDAIVATTATGSSITVGAAASNSSIDYAGDLDWWSVSLTAGTTYQFRMNANGLPDPYLRLMSTTGLVQLAANDDGGGGTNSLITYTPTATGTYYLSAQAYANNTGNYTLAATSVVSADTILATVGTGASLTVGAAASAGITDTAADQDWWSVALTAGTTYRFELNGVAVGDDPYLRLLDAAGTQITFNDDNGTNLNSLITYTPGTSGTYFLSAQAFNTKTGSYTIRATTVAASVDTIAANNTTSSSITAGGAAGAGTIDSAGDRDWWSISLTAGHSYQFELNGTTLTDSYLRLLNSAGGEITANDDGGTGLNAMITYTPTSTGTYYLVAAAYGNLTGNYTVSATDRGATADIDAATTTTSVLTVNGAAATSTVGMAGDHDWWKVSLTAGTEYRFQLDGNGLADPYLRLMDTAGLEISFDDDSGSGLNSQIYYTAASTGIYYLSAQGVGADTGDYSLTAITDIAATAATSAVLAVNGAAGSSTIGAVGDYDWWKVSLTQGTQYRFTLDGAGLADPFLSLMNPTGNEIAYDNDSGAGSNSQIEFTATTTGIHYLSAQGIGTATGGYTLTAITF